MDRRNGGFGQIPPAAAKTLINFLFAAVISFRTIPFIITPGANPFVLATAAVDIAQVMTG